jgi:glyoxylase-like metal-dependent hydrolase (beta-lactamase superfamily II)
MTAGPDASFESHHEREAAVVASPREVLVDLVEPVLTAEIPSPHGYVFRRAGSRLARLRAGLHAGADQIHMPCLFFVLRHPAEGVVLVDTGLSAEAHESVRSDFGLPMSIVFRAMKPLGASFGAQLRERGIEPEDVRTVLMTHLHVDHTSGMRALPSARFTCTAREWEAAHERLAPARGYAGRHLPPREPMTLLDLERDGEPHASFARSIDVFGDGSVRLLSTPGHTPGHMSVLVRTREREVLLAGDAAYTLRSISEGVLPLITSDDEQSRHTLAALKAYGEEHPDTLVVPTHDPEAWHSLYDGA